MRIVFLYGVDEHGRRVLSKAGEAGEARDGGQAAILCDWHGGVFDVASLD